MVPNTSDDLPDPETPVNTVSRRLGISTLTSFRLFSRAPWTRITSWLSAWCWLDLVEVGLAPPHPGRAAGPLLRKCSRSPGAGEEHRGAPLRALDVLCAHPRVRVLDLRPPRCAAFQRAPPAA